VAKLSTFFRKKPKRKKTTEKKHRKKTPKKNHRKKVVDRKKMFLFKRVAAVVIDRS